jgi:hypothetical protein
VYRIIAMLTPQEYQGVRENVRLHFEAPPVQHAGQIITEHFSSVTALGALRLREHVLFTEKMNTNEMILALTELFLSVLPSKD